MFSKGRASDLVRCDSPVNTLSMTNDHVLEKTDTYVINVKNSPVSVQVQEVIKADKSGLSVKLHESGWSWVVSETSVYFSRYSEDDPSASCYKLPLPPNHSLNKWNTSLVDVSADLLQPSIINVVAAISPDGNVRFWNGVSSDSSYKDYTLNLNGDRIHSLAKLERCHGFIVFTTRGSVYILSIMSFQEPIAILPLFPPQSVFSEIGKRVSSLFFGAASAPKTTQNAVKFITWYCTKREFDVAVLMTNTNLQCWKIYSANDYDQVMLFDYNVLSTLKQKISDQYSLHANYQDHQISLLDLQLTSQGLIILYAFVEMHTPPTISYGLAQLLSFLDCNPPSIEKLVDLPHCQAYLPESELLICDVSLQGCVTSPQLVVYGKHFIIPVYLHKEGEERETSSLLVSGTNFSPPNAIVGSGVANGELLLFTLQHGVVSVTVFPQSESISPSKRLKTTSYISRGTDVHIHQFTPATESILKETQELQKGFMLYLNNNIVDAITLCNDLFPAMSFVPGIDTVGDMCVQRLSEMILNDVPSADPRWGDTNINVSGSLMIINQLHDKQEAHRQFVLFLTEVGLLDLLTCVTVRGKPMLTCVLLCENAEKIAAAIALKKMHSNYIDESIKCVIKERVVISNIPHGLSAHDIFYSQIINVDDIFEALLDYSDTLLYSSNSVIDSLLIVINIASIIQTMLHKARQYRTAHSNLYVSCRTSNIAEPEFLPWTACDRSFTIIHRILSALMNHWSDCHNEPISDLDKQSFWNVYLELAVILFAGLDDLCLSVKKTDNKHREVEVEEMFESYKKKYIESAFIAGSVNIAVQLAEEYYYFPTLVKVCEDSHNLELLKKYFDQFSSKGFRDYVFKHYLDNGKFKQLLNFSQHFPSELSCFLFAHPNLSWIHFLAVNDYQKASQALGDLAFKEQKFLAKKKTILSIDKLSLLCQQNTGNLTEMKEMERELRKVECQQQLSTELLETRGFDSQLMPPLPPEEVVELFLSDDNSATSYLYALEYLNLAFPDIADTQQLKLYIWSKCALQTDWSKLSTDNPEEQFQETFFFHLIKDSYRNGLDVTRLLPTLDEMLNSPYLSDAGMLSNKVFVFFMKIGYEQINHIKL